MPDLKLCSATDLFVVYNQALAELRERGILCSQNNPVADYAEYLARQSFGLTKAVNSTPGHDATDSDGLRYQIKGRRINRSKSPLAGILRNLDKRPFDHLIGVVFNPDFSIYRAIAAPIDAIVKVAVFRQHVNGWQIRFNDGLWKQDGVRDVTAEITIAAGA